MPTVNMTDMDWLTLLDGWMFTFNQVQQGGPTSNGTYQVAIPVTFTANEAFSPFNINVPIAVPSQSVAFSNSQPSWSVGALSLTQYELGGLPNGPVVDGVSHSIIISGSNTSAETITVTFYITYVFWYLA